MKLEQNQFVSLRVTEPINNDKNNVHKKPDMIFRSFSHVLLIS